MEIKPIENDPIIDPPRKRGRPRKNKIIDKPQKLIERKKISKENENREIILHLPLFKNKTSNSSPESEKNAFTMGEESTDNNNNKNNDKDRDDKDKDNNDKDKENYIDEAILTISDQESQSADEDHLHIEELLNEIKKRNKIIKRLREENAALKNVVGENAFMSCREIRTIPMNIAFIDNKNGNTLICEKTNIVCWWDTYNFDTLPCFIPERYSNGKFYVFGCFCSFDCAIAYNLSLNDYKVSDRNSLIKKLYFTIIGENDDIPVAAPREILEKFGGNLGIEEYRKISRSINKEYKLILPPMINLIACIEEKTKDKNMIRSTIPEVKHSFIDEKNIIPVKKKLLHDGGNLDIIDTIGIKEKKIGFF